MASLALAAKAKAPLLMSRPAPARPRRLARPGFPAPLASLAAIAARPESQPGLGTASEEAGGPPRLLPAPEAQSAQEGEQDPLASFEQDIIAKLSSSAAELGGEGDKKAAFCGSKHSAWVPEAPFGFDFSGACEVHDKCYREALLSRAQCDDQIMQNMMKACMTYKRVRLCFKVARIYYRALRIFGRKNYGVD